MAKKNEAAEKDWARDRANRRLGKKMKSYESKMHAFRKALFTPDVAYKVLDMRDDEEIEKLGTVIAKHIDSYLEGR